MVGTGSGGQPRRSRPQQSHQPGAAGTGAPLQRTATGRAAQAVRLVWCKGRLRGRRKAGLTGPLAWRAAADAAAERAGIQRLT